MQDYRCDCSLISNGYVWIDSAKTDKDGDSITGLVPELPLHLVGSATPAFCLVKAAAATAATSRREHASGPRVMGAHRGLALWWPGRDPVASPCIIHRLRFDKHLKRKGKGGEKYLLSSHIVHTSLVAVLYESTGKVQSPLD